MDIFIERLEESYALCRLPDKERHLIRLPLRELPEGVKELDVVTLKTNGTMFINSYAKECRMESIAKALKCKKYHFIPKNE